MSSPPRSFCEDFAGLPLTRIRPPSTSSCTRERESSGQWAVTNRSSRVPASVSIARSWRISGWAPTGAVRLYQGRYAPGMDSTGRPSEACPRRRTVHMPNAHLRYKSTPRVVVRNPPNLARAARAQRGERDKDYFSKIKRVRVLDGDGSHKNSTTNFEGEIT